MPALPFPTGPTAERPPDQHLAPLPPSPLAGSYVPLAECTPHPLAGARLWRAPSGHWLAPAFRGWAVDLGARELPDEGDEQAEEALAELILDWVEVVRGTDWEPHQGTRLDHESQDEWLELRTVIARVGWGPAGAEAAWHACRQRPWSRDLPSAAGWAGGGWVLPAVPDEPEPAFARPVLEARGLLRWAYITRWAAPVPVPEPPLPVEPEPEDLGWQDVLSRLRADHYTGEALEEAEQTAIEVLGLAGLGPRTPDEAEDEPLPDRDLRAACAHESPLMRAAAWFLLRSEADTWLACAYGECQHHWAVEAEEDQFEQEEVLEMASRGVSNPLDAALARRRLLTLAFGDINDVPLAGTDGLDDFLAFYEGWVAAGRPEEDFEDAARELRGDDPPGPQRREHGEEQ
ncbi:hypothetical protein ER308_20180 [Egibacter rhizosphaerae]|uniref:Uncharacterized protein n=1 Tax=Egibacter rhizosphaerae TaxID=1670831 RepID=A0A411YKD4_9ACTN|nr:hypothetical protein [Egibacter rhizosphaerae]QBI21655.1 hypothetical protein ER308_20180 [Egibacter rhizosphaerae]